MSVALVNLQENWSRLLLVCEGVAEPVEFDGSREQQLLEAIKRLPQVETVVEGYRSALRHLDGLERAAMTNYGDELPLPVTEAFLLFCHRNAYPVITIWLLLLQP